MGNDYFNFKQFSIQQADVAMKVGVDSVLLGAWTSVMEAQVGLDIGTGTGLLALMLVQKSKNLKMDAVEVDEGAVKKAKQNVANSKFSSQIQVIHQTIQAFVQNKKGEYDIIISNPPYFTEDSKPLGEARKMARHNDSLPLNELLDCVSYALKNNGVFFFVYPYNNWSLIEELVAKKGLFVHSKTVVYPTPQKTPKRVLYKLGKKSLPFAESIIHIRENGLYTEQYIELTREYYLHLK